MGFPFKTAEKVLKENNISYEKKILFDTKHTKLGDDERIINIKYDDRILIFTAYF